ncbi:hypothetical protein CLHUN_23060 [Ruminiclostridium hungatei]|uniref:Phage protein n=1 Tax=Ruminiclostridium hungatei TaxID=48256 RepID=A0A1V4SK56_RUMHU|nr:hypothetical protein [Ruminiclostridium hungatei]OPX43825.1 hypothetical protein CLHUN_23060 [Ruminiclostridium hungatei]
MVNVFIDAIALKINAELGEGFTIYKEVQEQGFDLPCFFIFLNTSKQKKMIGKRYFREQQFVIEYHPGTGGKKAQINAMIPRLNTALEYVAAEGDMFTGSKMSCEVIGEVLHFYVNYNYHVYEPANALETMEDVELDSRLKVE